EVELRIVNPNRVTATETMLCHLDQGALAQIVGVRFEGQPENHNFPVTRGGNLFEEALEMALVTRQQAFQQRYRGAGLASTMREGPNILGKTRPAERISGA